MTKFLLFFFSICIFVLGSGCATMGGVEKSKVDGVTRAYSHSVDETRASVLKALETVGGKIDKDRTTNNAIFATVWNSGWTWGTLNRARGVAAAS